MLSDFGIENITTNNDEWTKCQFVHAIIAISERDNTVVGGIRVHINEGDSILPISQALKQIEPNLDGWLQIGNIGKTAEICGLWNSKKVFGKGLSFFLTRAAVAHARYLKMDRVVGLAAPYTREMSESVGFRIVKELGESGTYHYPNDRHLASIMEISPLENMTTSSEENRKRILSLNKFPIQQYQEIYRNSFCPISYNLIG